MIPDCPIHNKPLKMGKYGLYCNQPLVKSPDGKTVLEWCKYKPGEVPVQPPPIDPKPDYQSNDNLDTFEQTPKDEAETYKPPKTETYRIQKQHSQHMSLLFLDYCARMSLDPAKEIENVEGWVKIFQEALDI